MNFSRCWRLNTHRTTQDPVSGLRHYAGMATCIQKQLKYYTLACQAAMQGLQPGLSRREILKAKVEAKRWHLMYQKYGGKEPLAAASRLIAR